MKKLIGLSGYSLIVTAQILSSPVFAQEDLPLITSKNLHVRNRDDEMIPARTGVKWLERENADDHKKNDKSNLDESNQFALISYADRDCVREQVDKIRKVSKILKEYQVEISLESAKKIQKGTYATARTEQDFCIPLLNKPFNARNILELGVVVPSPSVKTPSRCVVVDESAIVQALNQQQPSSCEKNQEDIQAKAVSNRSGDKGRAPASNGGSDSGTSLGTGLAQ